MEEFATTLRRRIEGQIRLDVKPSVLLGEHITEHGLSGLVAAVGALRSRIIKALLGQCEEQIVPLLGAALEPSTLEWLLVRFELLSEAEKVALSGGPHAKLVKLALDWASRDLILRPGLNRLNEVNDEPLDVREVWLTLAGERADNGGVIWEAVVAEDHVEAERLWDETLELARKL